MGGGIAVLAAYWHRGGLEVFRTKGDEITKIASGAVESLSQVRGSGKKFLIVSRDLLMHTRKKYPPTTMENIKKAVSGEIKDIFPLERPAFALSIFETTSAHCFVDVWAWESGPYEKLRPVFPFTHVVPEDLLFASDEPEITIFESGELKHIIAHDKKGFSGGLSLKTISDNTLELFMRSIRASSGEIKRIISYIDKSKLHMPALMQVVYEQPMEYPPCLRHLSGRDFKEFKVAGESALKSNIELLQRAAIYLLVIYSIALFITKRNYDKAIDEVSGKLNSLTSDIAAAKATGEGGRYTDIINALRERTGKKINPLPVMEALAEFLPAGSYLTRIALNENTLEFQAVSKEPLEVIKVLSAAKCIRTISLKGGAPYKDPQGLYTFSLAAELKACN